MRTQNRFNTKNHHFAFFPLYQWISLLISYFYSFSYSRNASPENKNNTFPLISHTYITQSKRWYHKQFETSLDNLFEFPTFSRKIETLPMDMKSKTPEEWRKYFESGNCSIYQIIFNAIRVAALDDPEEFKLRRNKIVERLYSYQFNGRCWCFDQTTEQDIHSTITQVFQDCKKACAHHETTRVVVVGVGGEGGATDQHANQLVNNIEDDHNENVRCVLQIKDELESNELVSI